MQDKPSQINALPAASRNAKERSNSNPECGACFRQHVTGLRRSRIKMKFTIAILSYLLLSCISSATSYLPEEKPKIEFKEALEIAEDYFEKNKKEKEGYYISRIECIYLLDANERSWLFGWANPRRGWYFLSVEMNGKVKVNPKQWAPPISTKVEIPQIQFKSEQQSSPTRRSDQRH